MLQKGLAGVFSDLGLPYRFTGHPWIHIISAIPKAPKVGYDDVAKQSIIHRNCTMKHYQHLNKGKRFYIWNALRTGSSQKDVAAVLNRNPSTISREVKRNTPRPSHMYTYHWALELVKWRKRRVARIKHRKLTETVSPDFRIVASFNL